MVSRTVSCGWPSILSCAATVRSSSHRGRPDDEGALDYPVVRVPSLPMPGYGRFRLGLPSWAVRSAVTSHRSEIVHLASPFCLGARGSAVAQHLGIPAIAVYQTDVPGYARAYHTGRLGEAAAWRWLRGIHNAADRTLAPSTASAACLHSQGIPRVWLWGRGVDTERFDPAKRSASLRRPLGPGAGVVDEAIIDPNRSEDEYKRMLFLVERKSLPPNDFQNVEAAYNPAQE